MIVKKQVAKNFSKSAKTYDKYAIVQKHMAKGLIDRVEVFNKPLKILEIGAGTGYFTRLILDMFPNCRIDIIDISDAMLEVAKGKFADRISNYILGDAENYKFEDNYDLILSNATFQWFNNLETSIEKLKMILNLKGEIYFSTFGKDTYKELTESFEAIEGYSYSQDFLGIEEFPKYNWAIEEYFLEEYDNLIAFLKGIKGVGATSAKEGKKPLSKGILKRVEDKYRELCKGRVEVTNHIIYVNIKK